MGWVRRAGQWGAVAAAVTTLYCLLAIPYSRAVAAGAGWLAPLIESPDRTVDVYLERDRKPRSPSRMVVATFFDGFRLKGMKLAIYTVHCNTILALTLVLVGIHTSLRRRLKYACGGLAVLYASHVGLLVFAIEMVHRRRAAAPEGEAHAFFMARLGQIDTLLALMLPGALWMFLRVRARRLDGRRSPGP